MVLPTLKSPSGWEASTREWQASPDWPNAYWARSEEDLLASLRTSPAGLSSVEAAARLRRIGSNNFEDSKTPSAVATLARQFRSPLVAILIFAAIVASFVGSHTEALIIGAIVLASCALGFSQEYVASKAVAALTERIARRVAVERDGTTVSVPVEEVVPGDVVQLSAGNLVPADGVLLEARDLNVSEATLTGETFPVTKETGVSPATAQLTGRHNAVFAGTSVRSGTASMVVVQTGKHTEIAAIAATLARAVPETEFARGIRHFGYLMTEVMLAIVIVVFFANLLLHRPAIDSLLFSLALAVGLTPELLPAIISVTLARGARAMSAGGVIVRRLEAIENLGSMDLLCTDKTGTLTEGVIHLDGCLDCDGASSTEVRLWAQLNASLQTGMANPLDQAIVASVLDHRMSRFEKVDEIPYDFIRKRLSVIVKENGAPGHLMICKGAVNNLVAICSSVRAGTGLLPLDAQQLKAIDDRVRAWCLKGFRVLGLAVRRFPEHPSYRHDDEFEMTFAGFLLFLDPPKPECGPPSRVSQIVASR